tara:strand:+ start:19 stop:375 length:357 start_codon:yes stop_codon:yes gene_type:complete
MSDAPPESKEGSTTNEGAGFSARTGEVMNNVNEVLSKIDWTQMGKYGKAAGIVAVVILAQVLIKIVIDTINFFPILPGLLELLGVVVLCQWSWQNLTTSEKRTAVIEKVQNLRQEYLG